MNLTRYNYEEYFILYLDNELNSEERRQVEAFVQLHPDLKEELDQLLPYKLMPDTNITYTRKEELLKTAKPARQEIDVTPPHLTNYEEWFTLYIDNELTDDEKLNVEQFISANPSLEKDFFLLQQIKLQPESILFHNKALLYRTEEKVHSIQFRRWRVAAAAILILGIGITTYTLISKNSPVLKNGTETAGIKEEKNTTEKSLSIPETNITPGNNALTIENVQKNSVAPAIAVRSKKNLKVEKANKINPALPVMKDPVYADNVQMSNNLPAPENNPNLKIPVENDALAINDIQKGIVNPKTSLRDDVTNKTPLPSNIRQASFKDDAIFNQDDKKNKLRGFFRKITRTFEKRTDIDATDEDGKLLVAGLAIKLK